MIGWLVNHYIPFPKGYMISDCKDFPSWEEALQDCNQQPWSSASDRTAKLSVPYEDIVQLEWLSTLVEDSFSGGGLTIGKENLRTNIKDSSSHIQFQTSSLHIRMFFTIILYLQTACICIFIY